MANNLKISGLDASEVKAAAKCIIAASGGKYDQAFDQGKEGLLHTVTIHKKMALKPNAK